MAQVRPVVRRITQMEQNRERLASLGTMAAGLAHELNNPASAARRAAADLAEALEVLTDTVGCSSSPASSGAGGRAGGASARGARASPTHTAALDAGRRRRRGRAVRCLDEAGVASRGGLPSRWRAAGIDEGFVGRVAAAAGPATAATLRWIAASLIGARARRRAGRVDRADEPAVKAIKSYAYMDRGEVVQADVREGLETTLTILGHKLKHTEIEVERDYDRGAAAAHRPRRRAQPGLDQPAGQRHRRARRPRPDHDHHQRRRRLRRDRHRRRRARESRPRSATACSTRSSPPRRWARAPALGCRRHGRSSSTAITEA